MSSGGRAFEQAALALRDHILPLVRHRGVLEDTEHKDSTLRLLVLEQPPWRFTHWTPFNALARTDAASPAYRHALARQRTRPDLPYGLEVWHGRQKVLSLLWADNGTFEVLLFLRGFWEDAVFEL